MLIFSVIIYLAVTIFIGLYAARRVHVAKDYLIAGRSLPLYMNVATVFATWFGAEVVLSISATFARDGLNGVVGDPFGASLCLIMAALFFARIFYRLNLLTIGDFYKVRYGKAVEVLTSSAVVISYLGWTSAQFTALGLIIHVLTGGAVQFNHGIMIGAAVVLVYTVFGGMWSVAFTDLLQTIVILIGLLIIGWMAGEHAGGIEAVVAHASASGKFDMFPATMDATAWWAMAGAFFAFAFGSIPQQDVFQRMTSAKNEDTAVRGTVIGATVYFFMAFVPMLIAYSALISFPEVKALFAADDVRQIQRILPELVLAKMPLWAQIVFFGALFSAVLSTASGAILAPTATFTENVLRPFVPNMNDKQFLLTLRIILVTITLATLLFALNSESTMYEMVQNAYNVTLTGAFVPLVAGAYWKRANTQGALFAAVGGLGTWLVATLFFPDAMVPANLTGFAVSIVGMIVGTLMPEFIRNRGSSIEEAMARLAKHGRSEVN